MTLVGVNHSHLLARRNTVHDGMCFAVEIRTEVPRSHEAEHSMIQAMLLKRIPASSVASTVKLQDVDIWETLFTDPIPSFDRPHTVHTQPSYAQMHSDASMVTDQQAVHWCERRADAFVLDAESTPPQQPSKVSNRLAIEKTGTQDVRRKLLVRRTPNVIVDDHFFNPTADI